MCGMTMRGSLAAVWAAVLLVGLFTASAGQAAEERKLDAAEITTLLTGKTALGENRGRDTRQHFDASGRTDYVEHGGQLDPGKWRVDESREQILLALGQGWLGLLRYHHRRGKLFLGLPRVIAHPLA